MAGDTKFVSHLPEQVALENEMDILINDEGVEFELETSALGSSLLRRSNLRKRLKENKASLLRVQGQCALPEGGRNEESGQKLPKFGLKKD